jgi:hypothetical protein
MLARIGLAHLHQGFPPHDLDAAREGGDLVHDGVRALDEALAERVTMTPDTRPD